MDPPNRLRPATAADYPLFARFLPELRTGDPTPDEPTFVANYVDRTTFFGRPDEEPLGMSIVDVLPAAAYVRVVVVAPESRGRGVGRALMNELATALRAKACRAWRLNVKRDNKAAIALYERCGMRVAYESTAFELSWDQLEALPSATRRERAVVLGPDDDERVERAWALPTGQLAQWRARQVVALLRVEVEDEPSERGAGFARFEPSFPGVFPLRTRELGSARTLLEACRSLRDPSKPRVNVVIEDDEALTRVLTASGARVKMQLFHMLGSLDEA